MNEFIFWWLLAGVLMDLLLMYCLAARDKRFWVKRFIDTDRDIAGIPECGVIEHIKTAPWWAHVLMILLPPSILVAFDVHFA